MIQIQSFEGSEAQSCRMMVGAGLKPRRSGCRLQLLWPLDPLGETVEASLSLFSYMLATPVLQCKIIHKV